MKKILSLACVLILVGCAQDSQNHYSFKDVGQSTLTEFGTVLSVREVEITGDNSGVGGLIGAGAGVGGGSYVGGGTGNAWAMAGGGLIGGLLGLVIEQALRDGNGVEYVIIKENGQTITIVQNKAEDEVIFPVNTRVMVQTSGSYQRVLPANHLPQQVARPKGIQVTD